MSYIDELKKEYNVVASKYEEGNTKIGLMQEEIDQLN